MAKIFLRGDSIGSLLLSIVSTSVCAAIHGWP